MKSLLPLLLTLSLVLPQHLNAQTYYKDAILLQKFKELYEAGPEAINGIKFQEVLKAKQSMGGSYSNQGPNSGNRVAVDPNDLDIGDQRTSAGNEAVDYTISDALFDNERDWMIKYAKANYELFENNQFKAEFNHFPKKFEYLEAVMQVLEARNELGGGTSGSLGSLIGVSQAEILKGIADWSLSRAQEELMQAFLRSWLEAIQSDSILMVMFTNTLNMLATADLTTIYTDGTTWKATFQQDLNTLPKRIHLIANLAFRRSGLSMEPKAKEELLAGLKVITELYGELNKGKQPDEILQLMGQESFIRSDKETISKNTITDRSVICIDVFLTSLKHYSLNDRKGYVLPNELLALTDQEAKSFWCVIYIRERLKLKIALNLSDEAKETVRYNDVLNNIPKFKLKITSVADNIMTIAEIIKHSEKGLIKLEEFNTYARLVFDLTQNGLDIISELSDSNDSHAVKQYVTTYSEGFEHVSLISEGIKTKQYGEVALNAVNFILWVREFIVKERNDQIESLSFFSSTLSSLDATFEVDPILKKLEGDIDFYDKKYPNLHDILSTKLQTLKKDTKDPSPMSKDTMMNRVKRSFAFTFEEKQIALAELTSNLFTTSEEVNKYAKLMASVISAETSEDIKAALEGAAMKTGGYLVRQKSKFSASVTFYPGAEIGHEWLQQKGEVLPGSQPGNTTSTIQGMYGGVALPIGVECAWGTNWRPVGALGIFLQALDLGAVLNYSLSSKNDSVTTVPEFGFKQVLSPGAYLTVHLSNNPITFGGGISYSPNLREINNGVANIQANALQLGGFIAVDLNVFPIYASRVKYTLKSKSLTNAYSK